MIPIENLQKKARAEPPVADVQEEIMRNASFSPINMDLNRGEKAVFKQRIADRDHSPEHYVDYYLLSIKQRPEQYDLNDATRKSEPRMGDLDVWRAFGALVQQYDQNGDQPEDEAFRAEQERMRALLIDSVQREWPEVAVAIDVTAAIQKFVRDAEEVVRDGLQPLYDFVGMLAVRVGDRTDVRSFYRWQSQGASLEQLQSPVSARDVNTVADFIERNAVLGRDLLELIVGAYIEEMKVKLEPARAELIGPGIIPFDPVALRADLERLFPAERNVPRFQRQTVWSLLDETVFAHILNATTLGAMQLATDQIRRIPQCSNFTLKELVFSPGVRDIFAIYCAYQFLSASGGNAYGGRASVRGKVPGTTYLLSAGMATRTALAAQVETGQFWFASVGRRTNPLLADLGVHRRTQLAPAERAHYTEVRRKVAARMPYVLVHYE
jgi:hypothetical protein